jgi:hypothetical protein
MLTASLSAERRTLRLAQFALGATRAGEQAERDRRCAARQRPQLVGLAHSRRYGAHDFYGERGQRPAPFEPPQRVCAVGTEDGERLERRRCPLAHDEADDERDRHQARRGRERPGAPASDTPGRRALAKELSAHSGPDSWGRLQRRERATQLTPVVLPAIERAAGEGAVRAQPLEAPTGGALQRAEGVLGSQAFQ